MGSRVRELEVVLDYVDPGSWLAFVALERWWGARALGAIEGVKIRWSPLELCAPEDRPLDPQGPDWRALTEACAEEAHRMGVPFAPPPGLPRSRLAHQVAWHGIRVQGGDPWRIHGGLFRARFVEGLDVGRVDVLVRLADETLGLDAGEIHTLLGIDRYGDELTAERARLLEGGVRGVPTLRWVGEAGALEGFQGMDSMASFLLEAPPEGHEP
jgi:predicted DsbA family dithiol-disulfide isomerase